MKLKTVSGFKLLLGVAAIAMSSQAALAAGTVSDIATATANVSYSMGQGPALTIIPTAPLKAGEYPDGPYAGRFEVSNLDGHGNYAVRWTPAAIDELGVTNNVATISGTNNPNNKVEIYFGASGGSWSATSPEWYVLPTTVPSKTIGLTGNQVVNADIYVMSIDAAFWAL